MTVTYSKSKSKSLVFLERCYFWSLQTCWGWRLFCRRSQGSKVNAGLLIFGLVLQTHIIQHALLWFQQANLLFQNTGLCISFINVELRVKRWADQIMRKLKDLNVTVSYNKISRWRARIMMLKHKKGKKLGLLGRSNPAELTRLSPTNITNTNVTLSEVL